MTKMIEWLRWLVRLTFGPPTVDAVTQKLQKSYIELEEIYNFNIGMSEALEIEISELDKIRTMHLSTAASAKELQDKVNSLIG